MKNWILELHYRPRPCGSRRYHAVENDAWNGNIIPIQGKYIVAFGELHLFGQQYFPAGIGQDNAGTGRSQRIDFQIRFLPPWIGEQA